MQVSTPAAMVQLPLLADAMTRSSAAGRVSLTTTLVASEDPVLLTTIWYATTSSGRTVAGATLLMLRLSSTVTSVDALS